MGGGVASGRSSLANITSAFATVPEYAGLYAGKSSAEIVTTIYENLFGRKPEPEGLKYWSEGLDTGQFGIGTMAYTTLNAAQHADKTTIENKAAAALEFTRALEAAGGDQNYTGAAVETARAWLARIDETASSVSAATADITIIVGGFDPTLPEPDPEPLGPARTFTYTLGWEPSHGYIPMQPDDTDSAPLDRFVLGHDRIAVIDITNYPKNLSEPTKFYQHVNYDGSLEVDYKFAVFAGLAFASNGAKSHAEPAPLMAGEAMLMSFTSLSGQKLTYLFIDNGDPAVAGGMGGNGVGSAVWNLDADIIINLTGMVGLRTTEDNLFVTGSFFS